MLFSFSLNILGFLCVSVAGSSHWFPWAVLTLQTKSVNRQPGRAMAFLCAQWPFPLAGLEGSAHVGPPARWYLSSILQFISSPTDSSPNGQLWKRYFCPQTEHMPGFSMPCHAHAAHPASALCPVNRGTRSECLLLTLGQVSLGNL